MTLRPAFRISVRALAEFCLDDGDLVSSFRASPSALEGRETHQLTQARRAPGYRPEQSVSLDWYHPDFDLTLSGRIDGAWSDGIEEIKSLRITPDELPGSAQALNQRQAQLYAALWALPRPNQTLWTVRLCYVHSQTQQEWHQDEHWTRQDLLDRLIDHLSRYDLWLQQLHEHRQQRNQALAGAQFPFNQMRPAQRSMAETVYKAQALKRNALIEAPTGTGKTLAALFPSLKALGAGHHQGVYYLTMKNTGQPLVLDSVRALGLATTDLVTLNLQAKERLCLSPSTPCDGSVCPYARGYFSKRQSLRPAFLKQGIWDRTALIELGEQHQICPYYLSQDWAVWADLVVGDVNYLYDTTAVQPYLLREVDNRVAVLIDESHNLIDRGRAMFSASLSGRTLTALQEAAPANVQAALKPVRQALKRCLNNRNGLSEHRPEALVLALRAWLQASARLLRDAPFWEPGPAWEGLIFEAGRFVRIDELAQPDDFCWRYQGSQGASTDDQRIEVLCLNPSRLLAQKHELVNSVAGFSATLTPWLYSMTMTGLADAVPQALPSPFQPEQFTVTLITDVSTRYRDRAGLKDAVLPLVQQFRTQTRGNALVFFSSYQQMSGVFDAFADDPTVLAPTRDATLLERLALLDRLRTEQGLMVMAPLGGVLGEGIDLPGDALTGVMVVGPGLPQVNEFNNRIRHALERQGQPGFDFAYRYPGLHKVLQAAGRCVRTETDHGDIWLVDDRFAEYYHNGWLPPHWQVVMRRRTQMLTPVTPG
ncbi:ATP-dependent DNA helicase [Saccharospirillum impatiens]|uniref:ATP-dependent DNA helicase n=1 Tax=Saccharospirillum impatiens TaxID=169438 RepID=UPI0003FFB403|nr:ATP-dependent DNA helicase [Saccharospirillum impatiens]